MSPYRKFSTGETLQALMVEIIRRLWHVGKFRDNKILKQIVDQHFDLWVNWRTQITMRNVDHQTKELVKEWDSKELKPVEKFSYSETVEGDTPLGGEMRSRATFMDDNGNV